MSTKIGERQFNIFVMDQQIISAALKWHPQHTDAPTETELEHFREILSDVMGIPSNILLMLSLHWLRNEIVRLRKSGCLKK